MVEALATDMATLGPSHVTALCTPDSQDNAQRLFKSLRLAAAQTHTVLLESHQSLEEAFRRTGDEIERLVEHGYERSAIVLHYTAGTKVMATGAVLAAVGAGVQSLRYLTAMPRGTRDARPQSIETSARAVVAQRELRHATELFFELRFGKSAQAAEQVDPSLLSKEGQTSRDVLRAVAPAYHLWDNFRASEFLAAYDAAERLIPARGRLRVLRIPPATRHSLEAIAKAEASDGSYPVELLFELWNNAIRRVVERRFDDAIIRLYRASELYAQHLLNGEYGLRTDDLDIRRVPPRNRAGFEALRRLDDTTIKLGHRKSYQLLEVLGHPVGAAFRSDAAFQQVLDARRVLVLAHGVQPCPPSVAAAMMRELGAFLELKVAGFHKRAAEVQFPWIRNAEVLRGLERELGGTEEPAGGEPEPATPAAPAAAPAQRRGRRRH